jgi:hypothetical protein
MGKKTETFGEKKLSKKIQAMHEKNRLSLAFEERIERRWRVEIGANSSIQDRKAFLLLPASFELKF